MKKDKTTRKILKTIAASLKTWRLISVSTLGIGVLSQGCGDTRGRVPAPPPEFKRTSGVVPPCPPTSGVPPCPPKTTKNITIDVMTLSWRRFSTPGMFYPPPMKISAEEYTVNEGDTWENLSEKYKKNLNTSETIFLEILLRCNNLDFPSSSTPPLRQGQTIFMPVGILMNDQLMHELEH